MGYGAKQADITNILSKVENLPTSPADNSVVLAIKTQTDKLPSSPASEVGAITRKIPFMDFWSDIIDKITIPASTSPVDIDFPDILVAGLPSGLTLKRVVLILISRALNDTSGSDNYIDTAGKTIRIKPSSGAWGTNDVVAMTFTVNSLYCVASSKEAGPVIEGDTDIKSVVSGNGTYNVRSDETVSGEGLVALADSLELYDVQVGFRVFFS